MKKLTFLFLLFFFAVSSSYAQDSRNKIFPESQNLEAEEVILGKRSTVTDIAESTVIEDKNAGKYQNATIQNLSKLYWLRQALALSNDEAIDNFVMINECDFYNENIKNDFKWSKIRQATRSYLKERISKFSDKFQIIVPVVLGRYDIEKGGFPIVGDKAFINLKKIEIEANTTKVCGSSRPVKHYPKNVLLLLSMPFFYDFVTIDEHLAQAFILRNNQYLEKTPGGKKRIKSDIKRIAYARVRMSFLGYQGLSKDKNFIGTPIMFGKIDGVDIFEQADETGLISTTDF